MDDFDKFIEQRKRKKERAQNLHKIMIADTSNLKLECF